MNPVVQLFIFVAFLATSSCNTVTLQEGNQIYCLSDIVKPIFINPPTPHPQNVENEISTGTWKNDDWAVQNAMIFDHGSVQDKRWEEFPTEFAKQQAFPSSSSISFSVYGSTILHLYLSGTKRAKVMITTSRSNNMWHHYTLQKRNDSWYLFENNTIPVNNTKTDGIDVNKITLKTADGTSIFWKIHNYTYRVAKNVSQEPSILTIPANRRRCFFLYASLCEDCYQEVIVNNRSASVINSVANKNSTLYPWQQIPSDIDPHNSNTIEIYRRTHLKSDDGFWALDFRLCPDTRKDMAIYETQLLNSTSANYVCQSLDVNQLEENTKSINSVANSQVLCSELGYLGQSCDISCKSILGDKYIHCDKHKICVDGECTCAWGYYGETCEKKSCGPECDSCDVTTGECMSSKGTSSLLAWLLIALSIVILLSTGVVVGWMINKHRRKCKCRSPDNEDTISDVEMNPLQNGNDPSSEMIESAGEKLRQQNRYLTKITQMFIPRRIPIEDIM